MKEKSLSVRQTAESGWKLDRRGQKTVVKAKEKRASYI